MLRPRVTDQHATRPLRRSGISPEGRRSRQRFQRALVPVQTISCDRRANAVKPLAALFSWNNFLPVSATGSSEGCAARNFSRKSAMLDLPLRAILVVGTVGGCEQAQHVGRATFQFQISRRCSPLNPISPLPPNWLRCRVCPHEQIYRGSVLSRPQTLNCCFARHERLAANRYLFPPCSASL